MVMCVRKLIISRWGTFGFVQEAEDIIRSMDPIMMDDPLLEPMDTDEDRVLQSSPFNLHSFI